MLKDCDLLPYKPIPKHKPDRLTYIVRFVCGAVVGLIAGCIASIYAILCIFRTYRFRKYGVLENVDILDYEPVLYTVCGVAILIFTIIFGFCAMILGDRFWGNVLDQYDDLGG